jgi:hypothetical protein
MSVKQELLHSGKPDAGIGREIHRPTWLADLHEEITQPNCRSRRLELKKNGRTVRSPFVVSANDLYPVRAWPRAVSHKSTSFKSDSCSASEERTLFE